MDSKRVIRRYNCNKSDTTNNNNLVLSRNDPSATSTSINNNHQYGKTLSIFHHNNHQTNNKREIMTQHFNNNNNNSKSDNDETYDDEKDNRFQYQLQCSDVSSSELFVANIDDEQYQLDDDNYDDTKVQSKSTSSLISLWTPVVVITSLLKSVFFLLERHTHTSSSTITTTTAKSTSSSRGEQRGSVTTTTTNELQTGYTTGSNAATYYSTSDTIFNTVRLETARNIIVGNANTSTGNSNTTGNSSIIINDGHNENNIDYNDNSIIINFRPIHVNDRVVIQTLHEEWFPVRYQDDFYDELVHSRFHNSSEPLFTVIAESISSSSSSSSTITTTPTSTTSGNNNTSNVESSYYTDTFTTTYNNSNTVTCTGSNIDELTTSDTTTYIAACVVGSFLRYDQVSNTTRKLLIPNYEKYTTLFYIMTLGTQEQYRHYGLGTILINKCLYYSQQNNTCGVIYLHVIITNIPAINFYEKLGFDRVIEIQNYYTIDEQQYNCYLYAKLLNGNPGGYDKYNFFMKGIIVTFCRAVANVIQPVQYYLVGSNNNNNNKPITSTSTATPKVMSSRDKSTDITDDDDVDLPAIDDDEPFG